MVNSPTGFDRSGQHHPDGRADSNPACRLGTRPTLLWSRELPSRGLHLLSPAPARQRKVAPSGHPIPALKARDSRHKVASRPTQPLSAKERAGALPTRGRHGHPGTQTMGAPNSESA